MAVYGRPKKVISGIAAAGILIASILTGGFSSCGNKKDAKALGPTKPETSSTTQDSATQCRVSILSKIYNAINSINSDKALVVNDQKLVFTMDEGVAAYVYWNNLSASDMYDLFGDQSISFEELKSNYQSFLLKLRLYGAKTTQASGLSSIILDDNSKKFFEYYENSIIEYNKSTPENRVAIAKAIIENYQRDFTNSSIAPYMSTKSGVARAIISSFEYACKYGWMGSTQQFPQDIHQFLTDIETNLCDKSNSAVKENIGKLNEIQLSDRNNGHDDAKDSNSYIAIISIHKSELEKYGIGSAIDYNNPDIYNNFNGAKMITSNSKSNGDSQKSGTTSSESEVIGQGTGVSKDNLNNVINSLPDDTKNSANSQLKAEQDKLDQQKKDQDSYAKGLTDGYNAIYDMAFNAGEKGESKPACKSTDNSDFYTKGYNEGYNKGIDSGYADGVAAKEAEDARKQQIESGKMRVTGFRDAMYEALDYYDFDSWKAGNQEDTVLVYVKHI